MCLLLTRTFLLPALVVGAGSVAYGFVLPSVFSLSFDRGTPPAVTAPALPTWPLPLDVAAYNKRMLALAHYVPPAPPPPVENAASSTQVQVVLPPQPVWSATSSVSILGELWPHPAAYPHGGAILPFKRVVAYYGNLYSTKMGILGELPEEQVLAKLASTTEAWTEADPSTPAIPAIHYIASVAQGSAGKDGMWRTHMPDSEIQKAYDMAKKINGILFLDIQIGQSTLAKDLPELQMWLEKPDVHLGIDPEFSMKYGDAPGTVVGTYTAEDVNYVIEFLAKIVREKKLPPKILVVHRFTHPMLTDVENIKPLPEVQVVIDMDGWGSPERKIGTYTRVVAPEPVQFVGIKLFYKNDLKPPSTRMLTKEEILELTPAPIYIQYQ